MSQYKAMLVYTDEVSYQGAIRRSEEKRKLLLKAIEVASYHIAIEDPEEFSKDFIAYFKKEFYKKHKDKVMLDISVEKILDLLDVNLLPLQNLETQFNSNTGELRWQGKKPLAYADKKPFEKWTKSAEENNKVKAGRKLLEAIKEISQYTTIYPLSIQQATSNLISFNMRENKYFVNLN